MQGIIRAVCAIIDAFHFAIPASMTAGAAPAPPAAAPAGAAEEAADGSQSDEEQDEGVAADEAEAALGSPKTEPKSDGYSDMYWCWQPPEASLTPLEDWDLGNSLWAGPFFRGCCFHVT